MSLSPEEQYDKIYRYCYFKLKDAHLAEDLTQEAFLRFFSGNNYISRGKPLAYLYTIAKNLCIDNFRQKTREQVPLTDEAVYVNISSGDTNQSIKSVESSIIIKNALKSLTDDEQEILLLRYANDLSMGEISTFTGVSRFAARRKINNALAKLKTVLRKEDFE